MAINLTALSQFTTSATALSNLVLATPQRTQGYQPLNPPNADGSPSDEQAPPAFLFDYEGEQIANLESDITDHYIEDNTAIQDQIAIKPITIQTTGYIGELNNIPPAALQILKEAAEKLTVVGAYTPALSETALLAYNNAFQLYQVGVGIKNAAVSAWSSVAGGGQGGISTITGNIFNDVEAPNQNKQQVAFQQFYGYWVTRTLFNIQTPWAIFQNMAIQSVQAVQNEDTRVVTDFKVTFKQIRTAQTQILSGGQSYSSGRAAEQRGKPVNQGSQKPSSPLSQSQGYKTLGVGQ